jgi:predicted CoA-binding protein
MFANPDRGAICAMLRQGKTIAPRTAGPSHRIDCALKERGYRIIPVRPLVAETLGEKAYSILDEIGKQVDPGNVCLRPGWRGLWIQEGIDRARSRAWMLMERRLWRDLNWICARP